MKFWKKALILLMIVTCFCSSALGAFAANVADATIDSSRTGSMEIYKYDLTNAEKDGVWDSSYVSTGVKDTAGVNNVLGNNSRVSDLGNGDVSYGYSIKGVEFTYLKVADIRTYTETENGQSHVEVLYGIPVNTTTDQFLNAIGVSHTNRYAPADQTVGGVVTYYVKEGRTSAPKDFTEDTLLAAMENAGNGGMPEDAERRGIGTPATRAGILEKLVASGFIDRKKYRKQVRLVPTQAGMSLSLVLPEQLQSPELTAEWEHRLKSVEAGELTEDAFLDEIAAMLRELVENAEAVPGAEVLFPSRRRKVGKCPRCGGAVTESKAGYFCESLDCKFGLWKDNRYLTAKRIDLTPDRAKTLLEEGRVMVHGMYSERTGNNYDAMLVLADDGQHMRYKLSFDYAE